MQDLGWHDVVAMACQEYETPFYLLSETALLRGFNALTDVRLPITSRHWLSLKTQPLPAIIHTCRRLELGVECVSEFEVRAALAAGVPPSDVLVNGVSKHRWLRAFTTLPLNVVFDSLNEVRGLASVASRWRTGFRLHPHGEVNPDEPSYGTQFGMTADELAEAINVVQAAGLHPEIVHFHLHSNVRSVSTYVEAIQFALAALERTGFSARILDCGGGLPADGERVDLGADQNTPSFRDLVAALEGQARAVSVFDEIWFENGRLPLSGSAVLVISIRDVKERPDCRYVICDGGRTNHALVSDWETHRISTFPVRTGTPVLTAVCGSTCMAFDHLARIELPCDVGIDDKLIWHNAGAYHVPWETRFSHGYCRILYCTASGCLKEIRAPQSFEHWWDSMGA
jgi:diaminopimelate decarboxylase